MKNKNILLVSSPGGHFVQLSVLSNELKCNKIVVVGTYTTKPSFIETDFYYKISDFSRDNFYLCIRVFIESFRILFLEKPNLIITTGAAPGLIMLICARILFIDGLWIDSLANSKKLSFSGRIAKFLRFKVLTQSIYVSEKFKVEYYGKVI
ncbi:hypothetical protein [Shewanella sp.]|uniref:hypothetical protein n=1 Tax=Shewanella sp. TaxID=50422 RepID=UPI004048A80F